jgi:lipid-binding SYLF domain-containing protein
LAVRKFPGACGGVHTTITDGNNTPTQGLSGRLQNRPSCSKMTIKEIVMKKIIVTLLAMGLAGSAWAATQAQLNHRIQSLDQQFAAMQQIPSKRVPAAELAKARGIVLLNQTKGGLFYAYQSGDGIAMVKDPAGHWSPPAFVSSTGSSLGFQAGGQEDIYAILFMTPQAAHSLTQQKVNFGAQVGGNAGGATYNAQATTVPANSIMVYSEHHGLFGGASVKGGALSPDDKANQEYYGKPVSMSGILFNGQVQPTPTADRLIGTVSQYAK